MALGEGDGWWLDFNVLSTAQGHLRTKQSPHKSVTQPFKTLFVSNTTTREKFIALSAILTHHFSMPNLKCTNHSATPSPDSGKHSEKKSCEKQTMDTFDTHSLIMAIFLSLLFFTTPLTSILCIIAMFDRLYLYSFIFLRQARLKNCSPLNKQKHCKKKKGGVGCGGGSRRGLKSL